MSPTAAFGRRPPAAARPPAPAGAPPALSPEAEAFRRALAADAAAPSDFERWRRAGRPHRWAAWALSFALALPGVLCFLAEAPIAVSAGLEVAGLVLGAWLRRARRRRIAEVAAWSCDPPG